MNKRFNRRLPALLLAWCLAASLALPMAGAAGPVGDTVTISTAQDLRQLAKDCALDTWSRGKTFLLTADLDLEEEEFIPIPTFGGVFEGQGHVISGLRLTASGSNQGLFRYIQPGAVVRDLTVQGTVAPKGSRSTVGGLTGVNEGTIQNCAFQGTVSGESAVGGLAGRNGDSGQIISCSVSGSVNGSSATGGIVGRNAGFLLKCENSAGVNLTESDPDASVTDLTALDEEAALVLDGCADTGGVAGYSNGVIQSCTNRGDVGYPHVGYNTGGIAGRQNGYLAGCVNSGTICGRKDVGGIVGQAEPWLVVDPGPQTLDRLRTELDTLDRLIDRALNDAESTGDLISARLTAMGDFTGEARESSKRLIDRTLTFVDENVSQVNTLAADVTNALDKISPAMDDLSDAGRRLERLSHQLDRALKDLEGAADAGGAAFDTLRSAAEELRQGQTELGGAMDAFQAALDAIYNAVFPGGTPTIPSGEELAEVRASLRRAFDSMQGAENRLNGALADLQQALREAGAISDRLGDALEDLQDVSDSSAAIGRLLSSAFRAIGDGVDQLTRNGPAQFTNLGEVAREASESLYDALGGLSGEMEELNRTVQNGNHTLTGDLRAVSRQFNIICNVMMDAIDDLDERRQEGAEGLVQDTSDEDAASTREGKAADCRNEGAVEGDRNVGGIAGAVAIELDLDPEDDSASDFTFGSTYETKAVLQGCVNRGSVAAKKDCAGGVAGRMDLGTALDCQSYGPVVSTGGNYVGGVAGWADASLRGCWAKNALSGGNYVGGVAGWASSLRDCRAIATIEEGTEYLGAVAGWVEENGLLSGNCFVDTGWAGVDGVSYAGRAEPVPFDELSQLPDAPRDFTAFTLTLTADGETVAQIPFFYGDDLSRLQLPQVPEREDCYGVWPEFDRSGARSDITVEAVYAPWITLVASNGMVNKLSIALAEGQFTEEAELLVESGGVAPPQKAGERDEIWAETWKISLLGSDLGPEDVVPLRLLNPAGGDAVVWQYENGQWRQVEAVRNGQYLLLAMKGTQGIFYVRPQSNSAWLILAAAGTAALAVLALIVRNRLRTKKAAKAQKQEQEEPAPK